MKRFGFDHYGDPTVFTTIEAPVPVPKPGQVQLHVLGFGLNPYDASLRRGEQAAFRKLAFPIVPGTDVVGQVTALGEGVSAFARGDVVINYRPIGGYSEFVVASVGKLIKKPAAMPLAAAAGLPQVGLSAYSILQVLALAPGQTLAVEGASGGVGALVVQLAKLQHLHVIATASARNADYVRRLGADEVAAYDEVAVAARFGDQADATVNAVSGGQDGGAGVAITRPGGTLLTTADAAPTLNGKALDPIQLGEGKPAKPESAFPALIQAFNEARLNVRVAKQLPFTALGVQEGHRLLESHHPAGKLVVMHEPA
ncbi:NADP-dependent oxidoreductase [Lacticaseibacillus jixianensis]|uniref:NADP-dependent oxidoreductase n=1 Tax=Lacticaseibacillus jixianensis TaxID=2486012 RepID=A0ABW4BCC3_9LACO|nr:NADP-dependent oxidoreductase [Lacticaseibacillus jixianensis]